MPQPHCAVLRAFTNIGLQAARRRPVIAARAAGVCCLHLKFGRTIVTFLLISHKPRAALMLKPNISPKSLRIELSNDMFAEWKCCEVFA